MSAKDENQTPFWKGYRAYNDRKGVSDNPYPYSDKDGSDYVRWYEGWRKADREEGN